MIRPIAAAFLSAFSTAAAAATWASPLSYLGIPPPVALMALAGTTAGLIVQPPAAMGRRAMLGLTFCFTLFAIGFSMFIGFLPGMAWEKEAAPFTALLLGFFAQTIVPAVGRRFKREISGRGATDLGNEGSSP